MGNTDTGILPDSELARLCQKGAISSQSPIETGQIQPASLDLRLGGEAWRIRASFLPGPERTIAACLQDSGLALHKIALTGPGAVLETGCVYLIPLQERLALPAHLSGRANPKSSTGRIDVFTRIVTDNTSTFDDVRGGYSGPLWLEVSPRTFPVLARSGDRLAQLRLHRGPHAIMDEILVSVGLDAAGGQPVGWQAKANSGLIDLRSQGGHSVKTFWQPLHAPGKQLVLDPEAFYILASRETIAIPANRAAEMVPIAPELGEFRVHYAGFFDPGFGLNVGGSRAVLEIRSRDVPFILEHGQAVAKLVYEPMCADPERLYDASTNHYQGQGLQLSRHFAPVV